jgi:hypothetical protein
VKYAITAGPTPGAHLTVWDDGDCFAVHQEPAKTTLGFAALSPEQAEVVVGKMIGAYPEPITVHAVH